MSPRIPPGGFAVTFGVPAAVRRLAGTCAVNCVELMKAVASGWPFQTTCEPFTRFAPVTVSVNAGDPTVADEGLRLVIDGPGVTVKVSAFVRTPSAVRTVTGAVPAAATRSADTCAVNCVALTNVVGRGLPFHCTVDPLARPVPVTVMVNAADPATADDGFRVVIDGGGFTVRVWGFDSTLPGLATRTDNGPD